MSRTLLPWRALCSAHSDCSLVPGALSAAAELLELLLPATVPEKAAKLEERVARAEELLQAEQVAHSKLQADVTMDCKQAAFGKVSQE